MPVYKDGQGVQKDSAVIHSSDPTIGVKVDKMSDLMEKLMAMVASGAISPQVLAGAKPGESFDIDTSGSLEALAKAASGVNDGITVSEDIGKTEVVEGDKKKTRSTLDLLGGL